MSHLFYFTKIHENEKFLLMVIKLLIAYIQVIHIEKKEKKKNHLKPSILAIIDPFHLTICTLPMVKSHHGPRTISNVNVG